MINSIISYINNNKYSTVLNAIVLLLFFVPFSYSYSSRSENEALHWMPNFIYSDEQSLYFYFLIFLSTISFQLFENKFIIRTLNLLISLLYFLIGLLYILIPLQDYSVGLGNILLLTIFPLNLIIASKSRKRAYQLPRKN